MEVGQVNKKPLPNDWQGLVIVFPQQEILRVTAVLQLLMGAVASDAIAAMFAAAEIHCF